MSLTPRTANLGPRVAVLAAMAAAPTALSAQAAITGTVREDSTGLPLAGAEVSIEALSRRALTDENGRYLLRDLAPGTRLLRVRLVGFQPIGVMVDVALNETRQQDIRLERVAVELEPVVVTAAAKRARGMGFAEFDERRRLGFGKFLDSTELARNEHLRLADLIGRLPGVQVIRNRESAVAVSLSRVGPMGEQCVMSVYLNGARVFRSPGVGVKPFMPPPDLSSFVSVSELLGVEVYQSSGQVPIEYGGASASCGVILLWTRGS